MNEKMVNPRHEWYQNEAFIFISIFIKNITSKDRVRVKIEQSNQLSVNVQLSDDSEYMLHLGLYDAIISEDIPVELFATKVEIKLKKKHVGNHWTRLEKQDGEAKNLPLTYPSSAKLAKNWDKLESDLRNEEKLNTEEAKGDDALNQLFKQIYDNASDDSKRAMNKSYMESLGTCLSTSWDDVKNKKVEITPPEGLEVKKFDT